MKELGYYNGRIAPLSEMTVPMNDRACWFGDGVYEAQLCRNGVIFTLDEHVDRLFRSAAALRLEPPTDKAGLKALLKSLVDRMDTGDLLLYYQLTRGTGPRSHAFTPGKANLWVTLTPKTVQDRAEPVGLITVEDTRFLHCDVKTLNLIPSVMANQQAAEAGCYEAVFYRAPDRVTECSHSNIHILKDGVFRTAPRDRLILPGIARAHLIAACGRLGIPVQEEPFTLAELRDADEILCSSSTAPCTRACILDGRPAGLRDPETWRRLHDAVYDEFYAETAG